MWVVGLFMREHLIDGYKNMTHPFIDWLCRAFQKKNRSKLTIVAFFFRISSVSTLISWVTVAFVLCHRCNVWLMRWHFHSGHVHVQVYLKYTRMHFSYYWLVEMWKATIEKRKTGILDFDLFLLFCGISFSVRTIRYGCLCELLLIVSSFSAPSFLFVLVCQL